MMNEMDPAFHDGRSKRSYENLYANGRFYQPQTDVYFPVIDPCDETIADFIAAGTPADVEAAVQYATLAFRRFSQSSIAERLALLDAIIVEFERRLPDLAEAVRIEIGAPTRTAASHLTGLNYFIGARQMLLDYPFDTSQGDTLVAREPIGVCGLITPWNWPVNLACCKIAPALAAGCTIVWKPSEFAPLSAIVLSEIMHAAGVPAGVFNMIIGGPDVGQAICADPDIAMISFTGSTTVGIAVARSAATTVKRVHQELGGNSPFLILEGADIKTAATLAVKLCLRNTGQTCTSPNRILVPRHLQQQAVAHACAIIGELNIGHSADPLTELGPLANAEQFNKVQAILTRAMADGVKLATGGMGRPRGLQLGYFAKPSVFFDVDPAAAIVRNEIFGPILCFIPYDSLEQAIAISNNTEFGLSAQVFSGDLETSTRVARQLRCGTVYLNGATSDVHSPFGGYKQSGNGRERGVHGLELFLEVKSIYS